MRAAKANLKNNEMLWAKLGMQKRGKAKKASRNLLEGVRESLYNRLLHRTGGTKQKFSSTQALEPPNLRCKRSGSNRRRQPTKFTISNIPSAKRTRREEKHVQPTQTNTATTGHHQQMRYDGKNNYGTYNDRGRGEPRWKFCQT
jgi:hypothetical protein